METVATPAAKRVRTQAQRREAAEIGLLEAAMQIVAERGTERMTLAEIGKAAGYSRGLTAHYFGSKGQLLEALTEAVGESFKARMQEGPRRRGGIDALMGLVKHYFDGIDEMSSAPRALLVLMVESSTSQRALAESIIRFSKETIGFISAQLHIARAKKEIEQEIEIDGASVVILGILRGVMLHRSIDGDSFDLASVRTQAENAICRFLGVKS